MGPRQHLAKGMSERFGADGDSDAGRRHVGENRRKVADTHIHESQIGVQPHHRIVPADIVTVMAQVGQ